MDTAYEAKLSERKEALKDFFGGYEGDDIPDDLLMRLFQYEELMIKYRSAIREVTTKLHILNDELSAFTKRNPIENIQSRIKRPYSIAKKLSKQGQPVTVESISEHLNDVARDTRHLPFYQRYLRCGGHAAQAGRYSAHRQERLHQSAEGKRLPQPAFDCGGARCSSPPAKNRSASRSRSARWRWISGRALSTRSGIRTIRRRCRK